MHFSRIGALGLRTLLATLAVGAVCGRDVVFLLERSQNTKAALNAIHAGSSEHFALSNGRTRQPFNYVVYAYALNGELETFVPGSFDADTVVSGLNRLKEAPLAYCSTHCCCSRTFATHFEEVLQVHAGGVIIVVLDCTTPLNATVTRDWMNRIQATNTLVFVTRQSDSYCQSVGDILSSFRFTDFQMFLTSDSFRKVWSLPAALYKPASFASSYNSDCANRTFGVQVQENVRKFSLLLHKGLVKRPWNVTDPTGKSWSQNTYFEINDESGVQLLSIFAGCRQGWRFWQGKCIYSEPRRLSYEAAVANCRSRGANLMLQFSDTDLLSEEFFEVLEEDVEEANGGAIDLNIGRIWLGLDDFNQPRSLRWNLVKGFISVSNVDYTRWAKGQPSNSPLGSRCASIDSKNEWSITFCQSLLRSICVLPAFDFDWTEPNTRPLPAGRWGITLDSFPGCYLTTMTFT